MLCLLHTRGLFGQSYTRAFESASETRLSGSPPPAEDECGDSSQSFDALSAQRCPATARSRPSLPNLCVKVDWARRSATCRGSPHESVILLALCRIAS